MRHCFEASSLGQRVPRQGLVWIPRGRATAGPGRDGLVQGEKDIRVEKRTLANVAQLWGRPHRGHQDETAGFGQAQLLGLGRSPFVSAARDCRRSKVCNAFWGRECRAFSMTATLAASSGNVAPNVHAGFGAGR